MSKSLIAPAIDRITIAREIEDGPIAADGYLAAKAADPAYFRQNRQCYMKDGTATEFCFVNEHCCEKDMVLMVCIADLPDGQVPVFEVHASNDEFATFDKLAMVEARATGEGWVAFNMEQYCEGYHKAKVHVTLNGAPFEATVYLAPLSIHGV